MNELPHIFRPVFRWLSHIDLILLSALAILLFIGAATLYSATGENMASLHRQGFHLGLALILMLVFSQISSIWYQQAAIWVYAAGILMLILVLVMGVESKGARRWLVIGIFKFQPSEMMKIVVPLMLARYFADKPLPPRFTDFLIAGLLIIIPVLLIAKEPDLGTSILVASAGFFVIYFAGISWKWLTALFVSMIAAAPLVFFFAMHDYQRQRVLTLLDPTTDRLGSGYNIIQSMIAIGSGGVDGKGWLKGDQSRLDFLPERHTDFIFAVFGEEFGLLGNILLLSLYLFIIWRGLYIATLGQDTFSRLLGGSIAMTFFLYLFVNTGMVVGLLPVVGAPLPMISYGGTSLISIMISFGLLMGLRERKRRY
jgi:rod shape determining protein RodA